MEVDRNQAEELANVGYHPTQDVYAECGLFASVPRSYLVVVYRSGENNPFLLKVSKTFIERIYGLSKKQAIPTNKEKP